MGIYQLLSPALSLSFSLTEMCIRDRAHIHIPVIPILRYYHCGILRRIDQGHGCIIAIPVSYTHLDVYKRQIGTLCCLHSGNDVDCGNAQKDVYFIICYEGL